jgi:hypothetical protein
MGLKVFIIRTRLQALIVKKIIEVIKVPGRKFNYISVFLYQHNKEEDTEEVCRLFNNIREASLFSLSVVSAHSFFNNFLKFFMLKILALIFRGQFYFAGVDVYPYALAAKVIPFVKINTFDDGSANILSYSKYYEESSLPAGNLKRNLLRKVFPKGCAKYLRSRTLKHYTIFPGYENIVPHEKVEILDWCWNELLDSRDLKYIDKNTSIVVLGMAIRENPDSDMEKKSSLKALDMADLYIRHPRETKWVEDVRCINLHSPAEAFLSKIASYKRIKVYHFNSTVSFSLRDNKNIIFFNLKNRLDKDGVA